MKRCLVYPLLAIALTLNAQAKDKDKDKYENKYDGPVATVPDNGATAMLLGLGIIAIALMHRRKRLRLN
jgi:hypothetical protein